ncbi:MAG: ABC transporter ATP-binding protein [Planctomycetota bacterium]|jgi:putative ABC transport system ATP-binding protein
MALLSVCDLRKTYRTPDGEEHVVLDIPSFDLEAGHQVALEGRSGSGKTTFLNLIAGILRPDGGSILLDGADMAALPEGGRDDLRARTLGYVFQTFNLLQGYTALENVLLGMMFGPGPDPDAAAALLEELGLGDRLHYKPRQMSIGQQQRVALARALANRPKLVLADEPTGNLDAANATEALERIRGACREHGASLLLVSHDREILDAFDETLRLEDLGRKASA